MATTQELAPAVAPTSISFMARYGEALIDAGYRILPIQPGTKKPGMMRNGQWLDYPQWSRHGLRDTSSYELDVWMQWPEAAIGIATGQVVAVDIDIAEETIAQRMQALAFEHLGPTTAIRIGKAPKRLLLYRANEPFAGFKRHPIEVLALGQQFVAYGIHPDTAAPYSWPVDELTDLPLHALPQVTEGKLRSFLDDAFSQLPQHLKPNSLSAGLDALRPDTGAVSTQSLRGTVQAISSALLHLPNADLDYDSWVRVGLAMKGALGQEGACMFMAWSAQSQKHDEQTTQTTWESLKPERIGAGTIYKLARDRGWQPPETLLLYGEDQAAHPARTLLDRITSEPSFVRDDVPGLPPAKPLPQGWDQVGGVLGQMMALMTKTAKRPQPVLALGASLCALGAIMGRKYKTKTNARSNLYIVGIAESGAGKNHSRTVITQLFSEANLLHLMGGNKIASGSGLIAAVQRQPSVLFQLDEFGMFLAAAADRKRSPRYLTEIVDQMTELYTSSGSAHFGIEYASGSARDVQKVVHQPCVCVYGTTTPLHFWQALQAANVSDGSLARFMVLRSEEDFPEANPAFGEVHAPASLIADLQRMNKGSAKHANLCGMLNTPDLAPNPYGVPASEKAQAVFDLLGVELVQELRAAKHSGYASILARIEENAQKLALIRAVSNDADDPIIEEADALWAVALTRHCAEQTIKEVSERVSENETESLHKRALKLLRDAGAQGMRRTEFCRKTQFMELRQRDALIQALVESGQIELTSKQTVGRPTVWLRALS